MKKSDVRHSAEQLELLQQYIVIFTIVLGLPGVGLLLKRDHRYKLALSLYLLTIFIFIFLYARGNKMLFPDKTII